jgi:hypothetical protein
MISLAIFWYWLDPLVKWLVRSFDTTSCLRLALTVHDVGRSVSLNHVGHRMLILLLSLWPKGIWSPWTVIDTWERLSHSHLLGFPVTKLIHWIWDLTIFYGVLSWDTVALITINFLRIDQTKVAGTCGSGIKPEIEMSFLLIFFELLIWFLKCKSTLWPLRSQIRWVFILASLGSLDTEVKMMSLQIILEFFIFIRMFITNCWLPKLICSFCHTQQLLVSNSSYLDASLLEIGL